VHLALEVLHVGVEANLPPRPRIGVLAAKRRRDPRAVGLVEDQRLHGSGGDNARGVRG
jgi:hypothetical protein